MTVFALVGDDHLDALVLAVRDALVHPPGARAVRQVRVVDGVDEVRRVDGRRVLAAVTGIDHRRPAIVGAAGGDHDDGEGRRHEPAMHRCHARSVVQAP